MGKGIILAIVLFLLLGVGGYYLYEWLHPLESFREPPSTEEENPLLVRKDNEDPGDSNSSESAQIYQESGYFELAPTGIAPLDPSKKIVYFFYANWCPTCRPTDAELKANENKIPRDIYVYRVNYNDSDTDQEEKDLAKKYNITYQHTFVLVDSSGKEVKKWNGGGLNEIIQNTK